jgi:hypothetical protein
MGLFESIYHMVKAMESLYSFWLYEANGGHRGRDHIVVGFIITYAIRAYHH